MTTSHAARWFYTQPMASLGNTLTRNYLAELLSDPVNALTIIQERQPLRLANASQVNRLLLVTTDNTELLTRLPIDWSNALERNYLAAVVAQITPSPLLDTLAAYWKMEEESGSRLDSTANARNLTDNNTVTRATGKIDFAAEFTGANTESLSLADTADFRGGDRDWSFDGWIYLTSPSTTQEILSKGTNTGVTQFDYRLFCAASSLFLRASNGTTQDSVSMIGTLNADTWYYFYVFHDSTANVIGISVNNAVPNTIAFTASAAHLPGGSFRLGLSPAGNLPMTGRLDEVGHWTRLLTAEERGARYNSGNGVTYPF